MSRDIPGMVVIIPDGDADGLAMAAIIQVGAGPPLPAAIPQEPY